MSGRPGNGTLSNLPVRPTQSGDGPMISGIRDAGAPRTTASVVLYEGPSPTSHRASSPCPTSHPRTRTSPATSLEVRERLVEALNLDLIGPGADHDLASERLPGWVRPSNWYLTGFLIPAGAPPEQSGDTDEDDDLDEMPESAGLAEESTEERKVREEGLLPIVNGLELPGPGRLGHAQRNGPMGRLQAGADRGQ